MDFVFSGTDKPKPWALALFGFFVIGNEPEEGLEERGNLGLIIPPFSQVAKQEKKKKKTGRARRMQYNRRFVNVVPTFGKRRRALMLTPKSSVILAFSNKAT